jgi:hypothetical protein
MHIFFVCKRIDEMSVIMELKLTKYKNWGPTQQKKKEDIYISILKTCQGKKNITIKNKGWNRQKNNFKIISHKINSNQKNENQI